MGIFDVFKKKEEPKPQISPQPEEIPISQAIQMKERGLTNNQIIQVLQQQGYNPQQVYDALAQAEARQSIEPYAQPQEMPREELPPGAPIMQEPQEMPSRAPAYEQSTEALIESVVEEKWKIIQKEITKMTELRDKINSRMERMEQQIKDLKSDLDGLHKAIISRVGEYDKTLSEVGTEIKAMEKVFKEVLPEMTSNIQELSKLTKKLKGDEKGKKETKALSRETELESLAKKK